MFSLVQRAVPYALPGYPDYLAALLHARGIDSPEEAAAFLNPAPEQLHDPFRMAGMAAACGMIRAAAAGRRTIAVYGDYDADGVCASAILIEAIRALGAEVFSYIPDRQGEGYGLNLDAVREISEKAGLLISVDCGVTAVQEARLAKSLGLPLIITDHHALQGDLPAADALVHPALGEYPFPELCGAGVAFKLACALLGQEAGTRFLDLAALATIADLVPLRGENRAIAALGLKALADTGRPGLQALIEAAGVDRLAGVSEGQVGYQLAPRLNAGGRLSTAENALKLLLTGDREEAGIIAQGLDELNSQRRQVEAAVFEEALEQAEGQDLSALRSLVAAGEGWNTGVVGLAAGKLAERFQYPAVVLSRQGDELVGSGRSAGNINLFEALSACAPLLTRFGGHRMAAGITLPAAALPDFRARFDQAVRSQLGEGDLIPESPYDYPLSLSEVTVESARLLSRLAPFGTGNPAPVFLLEDVPLLSARAVGSGGSHLKLSLGQPGAACGGIAFRQGHLAGRLPGRVTVLCSVEENTFRGVSSAQVNVKGLFPGSQAYPEDEKAERRAMLDALAGLPADPGKGRALPLDALPDDIPARGTLLAAWCRETAEALHRRYPRLWPLAEAADDPRAFSAIVYRPDWRRSFARFSRVVMADGLLHPGEAAMIAGATGAGRVLALPRSRALERALEGLRADKGELRDTYIRLKQGLPIGEEPREMSALRILAELGLISLDARGAFCGMREVRRCEPGESALFRNLNA